MPRQQNGVYFMEVMMQSVNQETILQTPGFLSDYMECADR